MVMRCKALMRFLSTLSLRRATVIQCAHRVSTVDFYPRSPCGERPTSKLGRLRVFRFLSTLSLRRATKYGYCRGWGFYISIHALLAESDLGRAAKPVMTAGISIHALLAESDNSCVAFIILQMIFLSTLSLRRATRQPCKYTGWYRYFYPRSPCGERQDMTQAAAIYRNFYPRSPCGERQCTFVQKSLRR